VTTTGSDPIVRVVGVSSTNSGTRIDIAIPVGASPGDVIVNNSGIGHSTVSNAFPTDLVGQFGDIPITVPTIAGVDPVFIEALIPGTAQTVQITGVNLGLTTAVLIDGAPIPSSRYTIVNDTLITLDMPQVATLGVHALSVTDGGTPSNFNVTVVAPIVPVYQMGTGDALNLVDRDNGLPIIVAGPVGTTQRILASGSNLPSTNAYVSLGIGNNFTSLVSGGQVTIPAKGWVQINVPTGALPDPGAGMLTFYSQTFELEFPAPFATSNVQSMILVQ
jgi:hypothetical protein